MIFQQKQSTAEVLIEHFKTGARSEDLPAKLRDEWDKIHVAHNLLKLHKMSTCVTLFIEHYRGSGKEIAQATAYRYMALAQQVWGAQPIMNKEYWRHLQFEGAQDDHAFARALKDVKGMNMARKNMIEILRLNKPDEMEIDPAKVQQHYNVIFIVGGTGDEARMLPVKELENLPDKEKEDYINKFYRAQMPQDVSFIEVKNDSEAPDQDNNA